MLKRIQMLLTADTELSLGLEGLDYALSVDPTMNPGKEKLNLLFRALLASENEPEALQELMDSRIKIARKNGMPIVQLVGDSGLVVELSLIRKEDAGPNFQSLPAFGQTMGTNNTEIAANFCFDAVTNTTLQAMTNYICQTPGCWLRVQKIGESKISENWTIT